MGKLVNYSCILGFFCFRFLLIHFLLVDDGLYRAATHGASLTPLATGMTGVVVAARIKHGLLHGIETNQTLLLLGVLIDANLQRGRLGNVCWLDDGDILGVLDTVVILVSGGHEFNHRGLDTEHATLDAEIAGELAVRGGQVAWRGDAYTEFATFFDAGEVDIGNVWVLLLLWVR
jgi:hypothetical protein